MTVLKPIANLLRKPLLLLLSLTVLNFNCKKDVEKLEADYDEENTEEPREKDLQTSLELGCYTFKDAHNAIQLEITNLDTLVKGKLMVNLRNDEMTSGEFIGEFKERILYGTYKFQKEGRQNTKDIIYMLKGNQLLEGTGGRNKSGTKFNEAQKVTYITNRPLTKAACL